MVCLCCALLAGCDKTPPLVFENVDITGASYAQDFSLTDHTGAPRTLKDYRGKVVTIFFGFTQCPDVCPTTLTDMMEVKKGLGDQASQLQVLFATVDPERDTQDVLANYIAAFDPSFVALRGNPEQTAALIKAFNLVVQKVPGPTATSYTINHSTGTYIFDPQGRVRLYVPHGADPASIAADIEKLL